jgi:uncharacterized protein YndB with AHSA1/START domain
MASAPHKKQSSGLTLEIRRTFHFAREKVFAAWAEPHQLEKWLCSDVAAHIVTHHKQDIRTGGSYLMEIRDPGKNETYWGRGTYELVQPPEKIVFTWCWTKNSLDGENLHPGSEETIVTVEFLARGTNATEVILTHAPFSSVQLRDQHDKGWAACLGVLDKTLQGEL